MYMAGGGCSLPGTAKVLMPLEGYEGIVEFVFDQITSYGVNACPPLLIGIGIAGSVEVAAKLSKKALLRPIGSRNANHRGAEMEALIENGLNEIGIGPGGISGKNSVMGVHNRACRKASFHPCGRTLNGMLGAPKGIDSYRCRIWSMNYRFMKEQGYERKSFNNAYQGKGHRSTFDWRYIFSERNIDYRP